MREIGFPSADGTEIRGFLLTPPGYAAGTRAPTILALHGGPQAQLDLRFDHDLDYYLSLQVLAARGYVVLAVNPRGSTGRGQDFAAGIYADWGHKDVEDVLAAVDYAVREGFSDPARLGVGGWSYGGMLTNYVIATDHRFRAATSGASISDIFAGYGTDEYVRDYETELGTPWGNKAAWEKVSFPFLHADRITTPTLFMGGDKDFNVPLLNQEQMYQALRSRGVEAQLVIYPGSFHVQTRPSFIRDRTTRDLSWFDTHIKVH
ncbi:MAG: prolyl oligopeptidase family serine peptidase [Rhodospirillales bacterium]